MSRATVSLISVPIQEVDMTTMDNQIELEYRMLQSGIDRYNKQLDDMTTSNLQSKTLHGRTIIAGVCEPVADGIRELIKSKTSNRDIAVKLLQGLNPEQAAYLALISVVDKVSQNVPLLNVARLVGVNIETQKRLDEWLKIDRDTAKNLIRMANQKSDKGFDHKRHGLNHKMKADNIDIPYWSDTDRIHVGLRLIDIIIRDTGIIKLRSEYTRRKTVTYLQPTDDTLEWIKAFNETHESNLPRYSPCIIPPKDWDSFFGGGYYSEHINKKPFLRIHGI
jgi:DNA-directed RNA polymerase